MTRVRYPRVELFRTRASLALSLVVVLGVLSSACDGKRPDFSTAPMPDFSLQDVNPASVTFDERVSPREFEGRISAWYFGHAT